MTTQVSTLQSELSGSDEKGPRKVSAKLVQGPVTRRAAMGEVGNKANLETTGLPTKSDLKNAQASKAPIAKPRPTLLRRRENKENEGCKGEVPRENAKEEMEVQQVAKVEDLAIVFSTQRLNVENIDAQDKDNPQLVSEYVNDIFKYMRALEEKSRVRNNFLDGQVINGKMRAILIDWLVQVHLSFRLLQETLYLTVAIIDRYLQ
ncbi:G2/mitotic-specific cyclin-B2, partial [Halocaridina rubra]